MNQEKHVYATRNSDPTYARKSLVRSVHTPYKFLVDENGHKVKPYVVTSRYAPPEVDLLQSTRQLSSHSDSKKKTAHHSIITNKLKGKPIRHSQDQYLQQTSSGRYVIYSHSLLEGANPPLPKPFP